jgi:MFS transporter, DHA1 family, multidrug resistance protein
MALTIFQNPRNWSTLTKFFVTFELCLLTVSVYIGSAIYTAGIPDVMKSFEVSQVEATLGLTIFVIGYALGTSICSLMPPATVVFAST